MLHNQNVSEIQLFAIVLKIYLLNKVLVCYLEDRWLFFLVSVSLHFPLLNFLDWFKVRTAQRERSNLAN